MQAGTPINVGTTHTERDAAFLTAPHHAVLPRFDKDVKSLMEMLSVSIEIATAALNRCSNDVGSATELIIEGAIDAEQIAKGAGRRHGMAAEAAQQGAAAFSSRAADAAQEQTEDGTDVQQTEGGIDVQQAKNKGGRKSKAILEESARLAAVQNMLKTSVCQKGCLSGSSGDYKSVERNKRNLANAITDWREDLLGVSNRGHALLQHMRENARNENKSGVKPRSFGCRFKIPNTECECCLDCWALAG